MTTLPASAYPRCLDCGEPVVEHNPLVEVVGFTKRRAAGGANVVHFRTETGRVLCARCEIRRRASSPRQEALL